MIRAALLMVAVLLGSPAHAAQQLVPTKTLLVKNPPSGARKVLWKAKETGSAATVTGDPTADGATLRIQLTPGGDQCVSMPAAGWSAIGTIGFKYKDAALANGPVKVALIKKTPSGTFLLKALLKNGGPTSISVGPGGPTVSYATNLTLGTGDEYCGGTATVTPDPNNATSFKVSNDGAPAGCVASCNAPTTSTILTSTTQTSTSSTTSTSSPASNACCELSNGCGGGPAGDCTAAGGTPVGGGAVCSASGNCSTTSAGPTSLCCQMAGSCRIDPSIDCTLAGGFLNTGFCSPAGVCVNPRFVFATSTQTSGNVATAADSGGMAGLAGADNMCATRAAIASLPGTYKAWMSDSFNSAAARLAHATVPYILPGGNKVADDWTDLTDGTLDGPIDRSESGVAVSGTTWTGTDQTGSFGGAACTDWSSSSAGVNGVCGTIGATTASWTTGCGTEVCSGSKRLYCVQQ